jgi:hypothetical protein
MNQRQNSCCLTASGFPGLATYISRQIDVEWPPPEPPDKAGNDGRLTSLISLPSTVIKPQASVSGILAQRGREDNQVPGKAVIFDGLKV